MSEQLELFTDEPFCLRVTITDALRIFWDNYWCHTKSAPSTKTHFERIRYFFNKYYMDTISKADVERFRRHLKDMGYAEASINKHHMILSRIFRKFEEYKEGGFVAGQDFSRIRLPERNPASQVPKVNERRFARKVVVSQEQIIKLMSYSDENLAETIKALYWTRLRPSDLKRVTSENVDFKNMAITGIQEKTVTNKNPSGVPYRVVMTLEIAALIKRRCEAVKPGTPLFPMKTIVFRWLKVREMAGMPWVQLRDLRRSAATHLLDAGVHSRTVAESLGHTTERMLPIYTPRTDRHQKEASEKLMRI